MDYLQQRVPKIVAHRGFCKEHTENTIPALMAAVAEKAEMIEMDVHETRDGRLIVHHDNTLGQDVPPFQELTYGQIQGLTENDDRCPLLSDCLKAIGSIPVDLEIKSCINVTNLSRELNKSKPSPGSFVSSFDFSLVESLHKEKIRLPILLLITLSIRQRLKHNIRNAVLCMIPQLLPDFLDGVALDYRIARKTIIKAYKRYGLKVYVWTVNTRKDMEKFTASGVDGIITDRPDLLRKLLNPK
ncbi:glycerophosphodiester phosphodiesterase [Thermodesulfobacteriota bacterium]